MIMVLGWGFHEVNGVKMWFHDSESVTKGLHWVLNGVPMDEASMVQKMSRMNAHTPNMQLQNPTAGSRVPRF